MHFYLGNQIQAKSTCLPTAGYEMAMKLRIEENAVGVVILPSLTPRRPRKIDV